MQVKIDSRYVYPFNDFAFKRLFGRNTSKIFLVDFLNSLIAPENRIVSIKFLNTEKLGRTKESRKSVFDIFCEDEAGNKFIIEIQKVLKPYFFDRALYYSAMALQDQLVSRLDIWFYVLNNLSNFEEIPEFLKDDPIFKLFFMEAEIANYSREEHWAYLAAMDPLWEANRTKAGFQQKFEEGQQQTLKALRLKRAGGSIKEIAVETGLTEEFIQQL